MRNLNKYNIFCLPLQVLAGEMAGETLWGKSGCVLRQIALRFASKRRVFCVKTHPDLTQNGGPICVKTSLRFDAKRKADSGFSLKTFGDFKESEYFCSTIAKSIFY